MIFYLCSINEQFSSRIFQNTVFLDPKCKWSSSLCRHYPANSPSSIFAGRFLHLITQHIRVTTDPIIIGKFVNSSDCGQGVILIIDHVIRSGFDIVHGQCIHSCQHFRQWHNTSDGLHLAGHLLSSGNISVETGQNTGLEGDLGADQLFFADTVSKTNEVGHGIPHQVVEFVVWSGGDHSKKTGVGIAEIEGGDGGGDSVDSDFLAQSWRDVLSETRGDVERSEDCRHQCKRHGLGICPRGAFEGKCNGGGVMRIITNSDI
mmetsp:Transcript_25465/g.50846  ORF Transcript_25465/g.50846 Transcript_25465/m.50846 type:complete len:261 (+) Transcript_25465:48-830(+)